MSRLLPRIYGPRWLVTPSSDLLRLSGSACFVDFFTDWRLCFLFPKLKVAGSIPVSRSIISISSIDCSLKRGPRDHARWAGSGGLLSGPDFTQSVI